MEFKTLIEAKEVCVCPSQCQLWSLPLQSPLKKSTYGNILKEKTFSSFFRLFFDSILHTSVTDHNTSSLCQHLNHTLKTAKEKGSMRDLVLANIPLPCSLEEAAALQNFLGRPKAQYFFVELTQLLLYFPHGRS